MASLMLASQLRMARMVFSISSSSVQPRRSAPVYQTLLREELRHMQEVLRVLENALA